MSQMCHLCGSFIKADSKTCPDCGHYNEESPVWLIMLFIIIVVILGSIIIYIGIRNDKASGPTNSNKKYEQKDIETLNERI